MKKVAVTGGSGFIGTHLVNELVLLGFYIINIDIKEPILKEHTVFWKNIDILDSKALQDIVSAFQPDIFIHLAANGGVTGKTLDEYRQNTEGTKNVLDTINSVSSISRVVITSSQVVCKPGYMPKHDEDFCPQIAYDESKVLTEKYTRESNLKATWAIVRPTYIWGPYHPRNAYDLFASIKKGIYLFPGKKPVIRSYGYVKNVAWQIIQIALIDEHKVNKQVFYVGDMPINYFDWVNEFSKSLNGKPVKTIPKTLLYLLAKIGDTISIFTSKPFLINSYRYLNMTAENNTPMEKTFQVLGAPPISLEKGREETVDWLINIAKI